MSRIRDVGCQSVLLMSFSRTLFSSVGISASLDASSLRFALSNQLCPISSEEILSLMTVIGSIERVRYSTLRESTLMLSIASYKRLLKRAELPNIWFHDLRHSAATIMISMGVNVKVVQEVLGHSKVNMTLDTYTHVLPSMQQDATQRLDNLYGQKS